MFQMSKHQITYCKLERTKASSNRIKLMRPIRLIFQRSVLNPLHLVIRDLRAPKSVQLEVSYVFRCTPAKNKMENRENHYLTRIALAKVVFHWSRASTKKLGVHQSLQDFVQVSCSPSISRWAPWPIAPAFVPSSLWMSRHHCAMCCTRLPGAIVRKRSRR